MIRAAMAAAVRTSTVRLDGDGEGGSAGLAAVPATVLEGAGEAKFSGSRATVAGVGVLGAGTGTAALAVGAGGKSTTAVLAAGTWTGVGRVRPYARSAPPTMITAQIRIGAHPDWSRVSRNYDA